MFRRKPKQDEPAEQVVIKSVAVSDGLKPLKCSIVLSALLTLLLVATCYLLWVALPAKYLVQQGAKQELASYAALLQLKLASLGAQLDGLTRLQNLPPEVATADNGFLEQWFSRSLPEAVGIRVVNPELIVPDESGRLILSNVSVQNMQLVIEGKNLQPEIVRPGQEGQHLLLVRVLRDATSNRPLKVLAVGYDLSILSQALRGLPDWGYLEFQQVFGENHRVLAKQGDPQYRDAEPELLAIANTPWLLAYWPQKQRWALELDWLAWLPVLILLLLIVLGQTWGGWELRRRLKTDALHFEQALEQAWLKAQTSRAEDLKLGVFRQLLARTNQLVMACTRHIKLAQVEAQRRTESAAPLVVLPEVADAQLEQPLNQVSAGFLPVHLANVVEGEPLVKAEIFRAYDIRAEVGALLTPEVAYLVGKAFGTLAGEQGEQGVLVARDARLSSAELGESLIRGLLESGRDVIDLGEMPTPVLYYATQQLSTSTGIMVTGSHNPAGVNGFKLVLAGQALLSEQLQELYQRIQQHQFSEGQGVRTELDLSSTYLSEITGDIVLARNMKLVIDCANAVPAKLAPQLFEALGCEVISLYTELDGSFPNHGPDPGDPANLQALKQQVLLEQADLGLAFDGDGDRLAVIDSSGRIIWPDWQMMLFAIDMLSRNPGTDVVFDVKCSRHLANIVSSHGGRPVLSKTGHSLVKAKQRETGALLAGEGSGHIMFKERWYGFDDALYAGARLLEILSADPRSSAEVFASLPTSDITPEMLLPLAEDRRLALIEQLRTEADFGEGECIELDGIRVEYMDGWGLVRSSNTSPALSFRFEAEHPQALVRIQQLFRAQILKLAPDLQLPF